MQEIEIGYAKCLAQRLTYVGELGWELYVPTEFAGPIFDILVEAGAPDGMVLAGYHALDSLRMEKGYRHFGHDISPGDTPLEAGLGFAVSFKKASPFNGRAALERQKAEGVHRRLVHLKLNDPDPILLHDEPIWRNGRIAGRTTSGAYGHFLGSSIALGYLENVPPLSWQDWIDGGNYEIEIAGMRHAASVSRTPFYDPQNERVRT